MRTGDTVLHKPSGERWMVACAHPESDLIFWMGWPPGCTKISDCELLIEATDAEYRGFLQAIAEIRGGDHRGECARRTLASLPQEPVQVQPGLVETRGEGDPRRESFLRDHAWLLPVPEIDSLRAENARLQSERDAAVQSRDQARKETEAANAAAARAMPIINQVRWAVANHYAPPPLCDALAAYDKAS